MKGKYGVEDVHGVIERKLERQANKDVYIVDRVTLPHLRDTFRNQKEDYVRE